MDPWRVLGLEATEDTRAVKRAYARLLKSTRPDEHPQQFQALHAAYKRALGLAEQRARAAAAGDTELETETGKRTEKAFTATAAGTQPLPPETPEWAAPVVPDGPPAAPVEPEPAFLDQPPRRRGTRSRPGPRHVSRRKNGSRKKTSGWRPVVNTNGC